MAQSSIERLQDIINELSEVNEDVVTYLNIDEKRYESRRKVEKEFIISYDELK